VIGLFKPTFNIRDAGTLPVNCRPPGSCLTRFGRWKQSSREEATHLPKGAGYKWVYTARRGFLLEIFAHKCVEDFNFTKHRQYSIIPFVGYVRKRKIKGLTDR